VMTFLTVGSVYVGFPLTLCWSLTDAHWGKLITYSGQVCFFAGCGPWLFATLEAIIRISDRGCQGAIQAFFVFLVASPFGFAAFFVLSFFLQVTSCFKICTGNVKGWEVTARGPAKPTASGSAPSSDEGHEKPTCKGGVDDDLESGSRDTASTASTERSASETLSL